MRIKGLHHNAYRCRDSEETRRFYEDFLGLPLVNAFEIKVTKTGRAAKVLHAFCAPWVTDRASPFFESAGTGFRVQAAG